MSRLPEDLIIEILSRLPAKPLIRFKKVSKIWNSIISDPQFIKLHLQRAKQTNNNVRLLLSTFSPQSLDFEAFSNGDLSNAITKVSFPEIVKGPPTFYVKIIGSCDGLVCLLDDHGTMFLWNPTTEECKKLPNPKGAIYSMFLHGVGYNVGTDDYGVLIASYFSGEIIVELYTLKTNMWREIENVGPIPEESSGFSGIAWNGTLYWLKVKEVSNVNKKVYVIVSFDMADEKFKEVVSLPERFDPSSDKVSLGMPENGKLCVFCECKGRCFEGLVLNFNGGEAFWTKLFDFPQIKFPGFDNEVLCLTKNGEIVLESDGWKLYLYNPKEGIFRNFEMNNCGDACELGLYVESLVSPNV
ncbi:F-box/kelch-repeat protein At3g06240-like [Mercurialis annua]|uniref:F-box/kelch-repeat protein At3g06240-like n=1 Tax=Mercurialis annua TaxID=3986 RepID=UPI00215EC676|nr:F-box/kelch-repeat protein At3g06240-like [Mercurialis annua]